MRRPGIPFYFIYGEESRDIDPRFVHVERVSDRAMIHGGAVKDHRHPHLHQLSYWIDAKGRYSIDGDWHLLNGTMMTWMPAGVVHGFIIEPPTDSVVISLSTDFAQQCVAKSGLPNLTEMLRRPAIAALPDEIAPRAAEGFLQIEREYHYPSWAQAQAIEAQLQLLFIGLARLVEFGEPQREERRSQPDLLSRFLALLDLHFREHRTVRDYAALMGTTPYLLNRATLAGAGARPSDLIRGRILQEAKRLLLFTVVDVGEVAANLGFADVSHFGRLFRREVGEAPGAWRRARQ
jgi:AraC family transcriptional activator of pobA